MKNKCKLTISPPAYKIEAILTQSSGDAETYYNYDNR